MTIAVIGQIRSGTSLAMQMLSAAGMHAAGEYPAFEDDRVWRHVLACKAWWKEYDAVKFVDPHGGATRFTTSRFPRAIVCIRRNSEAQADSINKFNGALLGLPPIRRAVLRRDVEKQRQWYDRLSRRDGNLRLVFEDVLMDPARQARRIVRFIAQGDAERIAGVVVKRTAGNYRGLLEAELIDRQESA